MSDSTTNLSAESIEDRFDRVDELVSLLVDDVISDKQFRELETVLSGDADARTRYIGGIQLHVDLIEHYNPGKFSMASGKPESPVLTMLGRELPGAPDESGIHPGVQPPQS